MGATVAAGFVLGLLGSMHCIGMCGPIALALPVHHLSPLKKYTGILLYNAGRVFTYMILGLVFSTIGQQLFIGNYQRYLSIAIGVLIIFAVLLDLSNRNRILVIPFYQKFLSRLQSKMAGMLRQDKSILSLFGIGFLNGWLPCGLVYIAIPAAVALSEPVLGILFMLGFGLATWPVMISVSWLGKKISAPFRLQLQRILPALVLCMGILFIIRGLNLGIPYLSPKIEETETGTEAACCHKK
jgi:sulfite exporter TauE/SafE